MKTMNKLVDRPISEILKEAGLINSSQLQVALMEKDMYPDLELEEILLLHGWLKQKTMDFFVGMFEKPYFDKTLVIGQLFYESGLLSKQEVESIVSEQKKMGIDFASVAVVKGFIKKETLDFFNKYFISERTEQTVSQSKNTLGQMSVTKKESKSSPKHVYQENTSNYNSSNDNYSFHNLVKEIKIKKRENIISNYEELTEEGLEDIPWIN